MRATTPIELLARSLLVAFAELDDHAQTTARLARTSPRSAPLSAGEARRVALREVKNDQVHIDRLWRQFALQLDPDTSVHTPTRPYDQLLEQCSSYVRTLDRLQHWLTQLDPQTLLVPFLTDGEALTDPASPPLQ